MALDYTKSFIEEQFPVSKVSKESFKERKAAANQTLTGLGKWWGRKPLVLVRAITLGCLLPVSDNKIKDKEVFLELMNMNNDSLEKRKYLSLSTKEIYDGLSTEMQKKYFDIVSEKIKWKSGIGSKEKANIQNRVFNSLSYDDKLSYCRRPEQMDSKDIDWNMVNAHLETTAKNMNELVEQLSIKRYGHRVRIGDCFSGGGSNVFEPARLGCDVYGSDLNPIAGLLTWADINILGCSDKEREHLLKFQDEVFDEVTKEIDALGIEQRSNGDIAKYYLYCNETVCPECGWKVPLLPSYCVGQKSNDYIILKAKRDNKSFEFTLRNDLSKAEIKELEKTASVRSSYLVCPHCHKKTSINSIRGGDEAVRLRKWGKRDWKPKDDDVFTERLYAIKYVTLKDRSRKDAFRKKPGPVTDATFGSSYYKVPDKEDLEKEKLVESYIEQHFNEWQDKGFIPSSIIEAGDKTNEPIRTRGWQYWHQLFNPRQLLFLGMLNKKIAEKSITKKEIVTGLLLLNKCCDWNSKLSIWAPQTNVSQQTFYNQAFNTLNNYALRSTYSQYSVLDYKNFNIETLHDINLINAKDVIQNCDIWITDPPYADAVNYEELSEFFISWDAMLLKKAFPNWYTDSKRALAIKGVGKTFNKEMVDVYKNLSKHMPDTGLQVVMFTHQDTKVWAELAMILWSSGLQVSAAWCIQTETMSGGLKQGNYVQGTVIMILLKQTSTETIFKDELYEEIRDEVKYQIDTMRDIDRGDNSDFGDADYLLAAYVAALKVLTSYKKISGIDVEYELSKARENKENSPVTNLIELAKKEAYDYLVPSGIEKSVWRNLTPEERFYIKGFEIQLDGDMRLGSYQEIARGFGVADYDDMFASRKANEIRLKTPTEYKSSGLDKDKFGQSLLRHILKAIEVSVKSESPIEGRNYIKAEYEEDNKYWAIRSRIINLLEFLGSASGKANMKMWQQDAEYANMLCMAIKNDSV